MADFGKLETQGSGVSVGRNPLERSVYSPASDPPTAANKIEGSRIREQVNQGGKNDAAVWGKEPRTRRIIPTPNSKIKGFQGAFTRVNLQGVAYEKLGFF